MSTPVYHASTAVNQALEAVINILNAIPLFAAVTRGALPVESGITCEIGPSTPEQVYLNKEIYIPLDVTFNGKHPNLKTLSDTMLTIHDTLTRKKSYPSGDGWEIVDISNGTMPQIIDREQNNDWVMASSVRVKLHY